MSKVIRFHSTGGPEVLQTDEVMFDEPAAGELRIHVRAIGLNRMESQYRSGQLGTPESLPAVLGSEASGIVEAIGEGVSGFSIGDRVSTIPGFTTVPGFSTKSGQHQCAVYGEQAYVPAELAIPLPDSLSFTQGASIWMQYTTAYSALLNGPSIKSDDFVLITAASSSVGLAAIQITNALGATPIATTRDGSKAEALRNHGAKHVIITGREEIAGEVRRITNGRGARFILDPIAGRGFSALVEAAAQLGHILIYGIVGDTSATPTVIPALLAIAKALTLRFVTQFQISLDPEKREKLVEFVNVGLSSGALKPVIDRTFRLAEIVDAHRYLESNKHIGKIVIDLA